ncbi:hypothetical protein CHS0354_008337 [Potamilus streckersoni]|uniref:Uncharacterized protein n=1 Tax=Potamilus streckersoni TaxID=2493646 RepID=A0AAE0VT76_9BIVA|nr:hypothetical protein CHS0354_008337 [Potamilus streckersoni]
MGAITHRTNKKQQVELASKQSQQKHEMNNIAYSAHEMDNEVRSRINQARDSLNNPNLLSHETSSRLKAQRAPKTNNQNKGQRRKLDLMSHKPHPPGQAWSKVLGIEDSYQTSTDHTLWNRELIFICNDYRSFWRMRLLLALILT